MLKKGYIYIFHVNVSLDYICLNLLPKVIGLRLKFDSKEMVAVKDDKIENVLLKRCYF